MRLLPILLLAACTAEGFEPLQAPDFPEPDAWSIAGPGGPSTELSADQLFAPCATLSGSADDQDHHNLVVIRDGWLFMPWSPEDGGGGLSVFDVSDPCAPVKVGDGLAPEMRESHTLAFGEVGGRSYLAVDSMRVQGENTEGGIGIWDVTDPTAPQWVSFLALPGFDYPDAYLFVSLSTFWQGDVLYVSSAFLGVVMVDVSDPLAPAILDTFRLTPNMLIGSFHVFGNRALAAYAGGSRTVLLDLGDPLAPAPVPFGDFNVQDGDGVEVSYYFSNLAGRYALFARNHNGGGPIVYDLDSPGTPRFVGDHFTPEGDGGYVFGHGDRLFFGDSNFGTLYDFSDPAAMVDLGTFELQGDLDTVTPVGNVAVVSVDDGALPGEASVVVPWQASPDDDPPAVGLTSPADGEVFVPITGRIGLLFDEMIEAKSVHPGSVRVWTSEGESVPGRFHVQEAIVNFTPDEPLAGNTTHFVDVPAGGVADISGNPVAADFVFSFSTGADRLPRP